MVIDGICDDVSSLIHLPTAKQRSLISPSNRGGWVLLVKPCDYLVA